MKCQNCNAFFVRLPCPECGWEPENTSTETKKIETMVKPSELKGDSAVNPSQQLEEKEETLVKPSSLLEKEEEKESDETLVKPSEYLKNLQEETVEEVEQEETLVKPSEYLKRREEEDQPEKEKEERLVKPSEMLGRVTPSQDVQDRDEVEQLRRPSEMGGITSSSISTKPLQQPVREDEEITERSGETLLRPSQLKGTSGRGWIVEEKPAQNETVNINIKSTQSDNEEFKSEVKDTLQEVITLLEKLMEQ